MSQPEVSVGQHGRTDASAPASSQVDGIVWCKLVKGWKVPGWSPGDVRQLREVTHFNMEARVSNFKEQKNGVWNNLCVSN